MRRSDHKRTNRTWRRVLDPPPQEVRRATADRATYLGSAYHKDTLSFAGMPARRIKADASICPRTLAHERPRIEGWLREAIRRGNVGVWMGDFPEQVWHREGEVTYEAVLTRGSAGEYHGYPLEPNETVEGLR